MSSIPLYTKDLYYLEAEDEDCSERDYSSSCVEGCSFVSVNFHGTSFKGATLENTVFQDCDLSNADFSEASFLNCTFEGGKLSGALFLKARLKNCTIQNVMGQYVSMDEVVANGVEIRHSRLLQSSLSEIKHKSFSILETDLAGTAFKGTPLKGIDLKGSDLSGIYLTEDCRELKGAKLDAGQAMDAARLFGIEIIG